jgi:hypothetical protein
MKLKFLSLCHLQCWITINSSWVSIPSFVRRVIPMNSIFAVRPFPLLKKKTIKRNISFFSGQMYFQDTLLLPGQAATKARMNRLHVVTVFNFPGATRNEKNRKYQTNSTKISYKLVQNYFLTLHWNVSSQCLQNYDYLAYERSCVQLAKENCERRVELKCRKIETVPFGEEQKD